MESILDRCKQCKNRSIFLIPFCSSLLYQIYPHWLLRASRRFGWGEGNMTRGTKALMEQGNYWAFVICENTEWLRKHWYIYIYIHTYILAWKNISFVQFYYRPFSVYIFGVCRSYLRCRLQLNLYHVKYGNCQLPMSMSMVQHLEILTFDNFHIWHNAKYRNFDIWQFPYLAWCKI